MPLRGRISIHGIAMATHYKRQQIAFISTLSASAPPSMKIYANRCLALRRPSSFTTFRLEGHLEQVFDLRTDSSLAEFANIIRKIRYFSSNQSTHDADVERSSPSLTTKIGGSIPTL
jgi:hypothetical protein